MKKAVVELARQKNSWVGYAWHPAEFFNYNYDDKVMEWANTNNVVIYRYNIRQGEYVYDPVRKENHPHYNTDVTLCDHTLELVIYYYDKSEVPTGYEKLVNWLNDCNSN